MTTHTPLDRLPTMASSDAKNGFAALLERVLRKPEPVVITRNARPTAVMLSIEAYERLVEAVPDPLAQADGRIRRAGGADADAGGTVRGGRAVHGDARATG